MCGCPGTVPNLFVVGRIEVDILVLSIARGTGSVRVVIHCNEVGI